MGQDFLWSGAYNWSPSDQTEYVEHIVAVKPGDQVDDEEGKGNENLVHAAGGEGLAGVDEPGSGVGHFTSAMLDCSPRLLSNKVNGSEHGEWPF